MKLAITPNYTFAPSAQQITLNVPGFNLARLYAIINQTTGNQVIYATGGGAALGCTAVAGSTLTLAANLGGMSASDSLLVLYEATGPLAAATSQSITPALEQSSPDVPGMLVRGPIVEDLLMQMLAELRLTNLLLQQGFAVSEDLGTLRTDLALTN